MLQGRDERPIFWIVGGPNGSGKSSLYERAEIEAFGRSVWIINPDLLTTRIRNFEKLDLNSANLEAVRRIETWLDASIRAHQTVGVETVLSTDKYRRLVTEAKKRSFEFRLIYVLLDAPERNIERVKLRVAKGGHDVPEMKIRVRHRRPLGQLPWFLEWADKAWLFDNSGATPFAVGEKRDGIVTVDPKAPVDLLRAAEATRTE